MSCVLPACGALLRMDQHGDERAVPVVANHHAVAAVDGTTQRQLLAQHAARLAVEDKNRSGPV